MADRALFLGFDALVPNTLERFLEEGILPNFARLLAGRLQPPAAGDSGTDPDKLDDATTERPRHARSSRPPAPGEAHTVTPRRAQRRVCAAEILGDSARRHAQRRLQLRGYPPLAGHGYPHRVALQTRAVVVDLAMPANYHNCPGWTRATRSSSCRQRLAGLGLGVLLQRPLCRSTPRPRASARPTMRWYTARAVRHAPDLPTAMARAPSPRWWGSGAAGNARSSPPRTWRSGGRVPLQARRTRTGRVAHPDLPLRRIPRGWPHLLRRRTGQATER